ncbi:21999_t:CDS:2, partial [Dentiscutata erythropus]
MDDKDLIIIEPDFGWEEEYTIRNQREEAKEYFNTRNYTKALEIWERIETLKVLARVLGTDTTTLAFLDLANNNFELAQALETNTTLTTLDLENNQLSNKIGKELARALENNRKLTVLKLK